MELTVKISGMEELKRSLTQMEQRQLPYAMKEAINATAGLVKDAEVKEMKGVFDRPTPFTLGSTLIQYAKKDRLEAKIWLREFAGKGTPATKYLTPQVFGGQRSVKRFERALTAKGILPKGMSVVPGSACPLDAYGNISRGFIVQILSYFKAFGEQGYRANITDQRKARLAKGNARTRGFVYFASGGPGTTTASGRPQHLPPGIYKRTAFAWGSAVKPVLMFVRPPSYKQHYNFFAVGQRVVDANFERNFRAAMDYALKTAR